MKKIVSVLLVSALILSLCSCSVLRVAANAALAARHAASVNKDQKSVTTDYWKEIPDTIPRFKYGTYDARFSLKTTDKDGISYMFDYTGVKKQDVDDYAKLLTASGFDVSIMEYSDSYSIMGMPPDLSTLPPDYWSSTEGLTVPPDFLPGPSVMVDLTPSDGRCMVSVMLDNAAAK
jgi:hypothetical protein